MSQLSVQDDEIDLGEFFACVCYYWWIPCLSTIATVLFAGYYVFEVAVPQYKASTRFELLDEGAGGSALGPVSGLASLAGLGLQGPVSEADTLEDRILSRPFVDKIYNRAKFGADPVFNPSLRRSSALANLRSFVFGAAPLIDLSRDDYLSVAIGVLTDILTVKTAENQITELTITHPDRARAAFIANLIVEQILQDIFDRERVATRESLIYFEDELLKIRAALDNANRSLRDYAITNGLQSSEELARTSSQLSQVRRDIEVIDESVLALDKMWREEFDGALFAKEYPVSTSLTFRRLLSLSGNPSNWKRPTLAAVREAQANLQSQKISLISSFNALEARAKAYGKEAVELAALEREVEVQKVIYESVITQFEAQSIFTGFERASGRVLEAAVPPNGSASPNKKLILAMSALLGVLVGIVFLLFRYRFNGSVFTAAAVSRTCGINEAYVLSDSQIGKRDLAPLDDKQLDVASDLLLLLGERARAVGIVSVQNSEYVERLALSLSKAATQFGRNTALIDFSEGQLDNLLGKQNGSLGLFCKYTSTYGAELFRYSKSHGPFDSAKMSDCISDFGQRFDLVIVLLPSVESGVSLSRGAFGAADNSIVVSELGKSKRKSLEIAGSILHKSGTFEPILVTI